MKKILSFLLVAAASLGAFFALGGCGLTGRSSDTDCVDGGVTRRHSYDAPKVIHSAEIVALDTNFFLLDWEEGGYSQGGRHWAFSVRREEEGFLLTARPRGQEARAVAVDEAFLREVHAVILKHDLPRRNGFDAVTSGLPFEYAPCSLSVDYASGERLYFHKDGDPRSAWANDLKALFLRALDSPDALTMQETEVLAPPVPEP